MSQRDISSLVFALDPEFGGLVKRKEPAFGDLAYLTWTLGSVAGDRKQTNFTELWPAGEQTLSILCRMFVSWTDGLQ